MASDGHRADGDRVLVAGGAPGNGAPDLVEMLERHGCVAICASGDRAVGQASGGPYLLAILRPRPGELFASADLRRLKGEMPALRVAVVGRAGCVAGAVAAMREHAFEYLEDPVTPAALASLLRRARRTVDPREATLLDSLQTLTPGLVHELRNPLSGVLAGSQMLMRLLAGEGKAAEYAEIVREEAQRLQRFLTRLAEFGRLGTCKAPFAETVDLGALVERHLDTVRPTCEARRIELASRCEPGTPALPGDPGRLGLAVGELIQNALDAVGSGGSLTVRVRPVQVDDPDGAWVELAVADTGPGMTEDIRRRACEPFFSTRPGALGIGLPLAQAVVRAHGGILRIGGSGLRGGHVVASLPTTPGAGNGTPAAEADSTRPPR
jgi:signal transduction histidine kinase